MLLKKCVLLVLAVFITGLCLGQRNLNIKPAKNAFYISDSIASLIDSLKESVPSLELSTEYENKVVFWGRDFGLPQYGINPGFIFKTGVGFYFYGFNHYWSAMPNILSKTDLGIGFEKQVTEKFYFSLAYENWTFYYKDKFFQNALKNYLEAQISYNLQGVNIEPTVYYMFGSQQIFQADLSINKELFITDLFNRGDLSVSPSATAIFASQNFLPLYSYSNIRFARGNAVKLVDYDFSLPFKFQFHYLNIEPAFHYNIPVALPKEVIDSYFYFTIRLAYTIYFDKGRISELYKKLR
jgi:hypothetical protein